MKVIYFGYDAFLPCLQAVLKNPNYEGEKIVFGFRDMGVDTNDWVVKGYNESGCYYYRKIVTLEIVINGNHIDMYM